MVYEKNILQIGKYSLPEYVSNYCLSNLNLDENNINNDNWKIHFYKTDYLNTWSEFIKNNPKNNLPNSLEIFNKMNKYELKYNYFIFYYLYVNGGFFINENLILEKDIKNFDFSKELVVVESCINKDTLFGGFIFCHKNNKIIELFLKKIETKFNEKFFDNDENIFIFFNQELKKDIILSIKIANKVGRQQTSYIIEEYIANNVSNIYESNTEIIYAKHYFNPVNNFFKLPDRPLKLRDKNVSNSQLSEIKIGVTFNLIESLNEMFTNGINQNSLYLSELLCNIGYDVYIIINDAGMTDKNKEVLKELFYDSRFKYFYFTDILLLDLDVLIQLSFSFWQDTKVIKMMKYLGTKLVGYFCGNSYIINSEKILYNQHKTRDNTKDCFNFILPNGENILDEIWSIPQMVNTNLHYWKTLYRCNCIEAPFVWSNKSFYFTKKFFKFESEEELKYINRGLKKKIGIFEPNISIMKWSLPCLLICENTYRKNKLIEHIYITNMSVDKDASGNTIVKKNINDFNLTTFNHILSSLDIFNDKLCTIESRYNTLQFMKSYCDVAVSHQWENPLNYLYFDLAWMGWPIVHNAHLSRDIGYYYEGFNYEEGGNMLDEVLNTHDQNIEEYIIKNRNAIDKYLPTNLELQNKYIKMIQNLTNV